MSSKSNNPSRTQKGSLMPDTRRDFLRSASAVALLALTPATDAQAPTPQTPKPDTPAGMPPAFGTAPAAGPEVSPEVFANAEKLVQITLSPADRAQAAGNWRVSMAPLYERRTGPHKLALPPSVAPYSVCDPVRVAGSPSPTAQPHQFIRTTAVPPLPADDASIAYAPVHQLSRWIESRQLTSERLTQIYLDRLRRFNPTLNCVITLTPEHALDQARAADREIAAGHYRGPLHGIPWGAKDLLDTAGIPTTWGAEPFRDRIPTQDATVTARLNAAGAVLVAKLSLGALALNDIWFGGETRNPWLLEEGSSGSSAGPGAATAAGLVGFAIGSETGGSIVSPSMRCGVTGLRPTFGRVPRTGAMTLCWSLDKLGPMTRSVEDAALVLNSITGPDQLDPSCVPSSPLFAPSSAAPQNSGLSLPESGVISTEGEAQPRRSGETCGDVATYPSLTQPVTTLKLGYFPKWMNEPPATAVDRHALEVAQSLGMTLVPLELPDWPYDSLQLILFAEAAAAFEDLTLSGREHELKMQVADAWPNSFRQARFLSAVDLVQADRLRRRVALMMAQLFAGEPLTGLPPTPGAALTLLQNPHAAPSSNPQNTVISTEAKAGVPGERSSLAGVERSGETRSYPSQNPNAPDLLLVPSLRDEMLTLTNFTGHPSLTLRAGFIEVTQPRSDWAPDPAHPLPTLPSPRRVPHGITLIGRLFDEATLATAGLALETSFNVSTQRPPNF